MLLAVFLLTNNNYYAAIKHYTIYCTLYYTIRCNKTLREMTGGPDDNKTKTTTSMCTQNLTGNREPI